MDALKTSTAEGELYLQGNDLRNVVTGKEHFTLQNLKRAALLTIDTLTKGGNALVHCQQGKDRSPPVAALIIALLFDVSHEEAFSYVVAQRRLVASDPDSLIEEEKSYRQLCAECMPALLQDEEVLAALKEFRCKSPMLTL